MIHLLDNYTFSPALRYDFYQTLAKQHGRGYIHEYERRIMESTEK